MLLLRRCLPLVLLLTLMALPRAEAQDHVPAPEMRQSPLAMTQAMLDDGTYLKVTYGSPRMRGREIYGGLVPYDELWRLGANEATELTTTGDILLAGEELPAGTYTLFAIPGEDAWTLVVNEKLGQWGAYAYDADHDVMRVEVPVEELDATHEALTLHFDEVEEPVAERELYVDWADTRVVIPVQRVAM